MKNKADNFSNFFFDKSKKVLSGKTIKIVFIFLMISLISFPIISMVVRRLTVKKLSVFDGSFTYTIVEKDDSFYYPTVKGQLRSSKMPDKVYLYCNGTTTEITIDEVNKTDDYYILGFEQEIIYGEITEGNHDANISCVFNNIERYIESETFLYADTLYTAINGVSYDFDNPDSEIKYIYAMDKESSWVGPY